MSEQPPAPKRSILKGKVFGVPTLYLVGGFVAMLAVVAWRMKPAAQDSANTDGTNGGDLASAGPVGGSGTPTGGFDAGNTPLAEGDNAYPQMPSGSVTGTPTGTGEVDPELANQSIPTNDAWLVKGVAFLIQKGYGPGDAQAALQLYLEGSSLSYDQGVMRDLVIREYGIPPTPPLQGSTASQPARTQGPLPRIHVVKNENEDSYSELANLYYGRSDSFAVGAISNAVQNQRVGKSTGLAVGTEVYIPILPTPVAPPHPVVTPTGTIKTPPPSAPKPRLVGPAWPGKVYALGSRGAHVTWIQQRLNKKIHAGLKPDGVYGPKTRDAVLRYQRLHRDLANDGKVGRMTWNSLRVD